MWVCLWILIQTESWVRSNCRNPEFVSPVKKSSMSNLDNCRQHMGWLLWCQKARPHAAVRAASPIRNINFCSGLAIRLRSTVLFLLHLLFRCNFVKKIQFVCKKITACAQPSVTPVALQQNQQIESVVLLHLSIKQPQLVESQLDSQGRTGLSWLVISVATLLTRLSVRYFICSTSLPHHPPK